MQRLILTLGGATVLAASFFGTLRLLDPVIFQSLDSIRIEHAKSLSDALEQYRATRGRYPSPFADNDIADLKPELVGGGFISQLPIDPYWKNGRINQYRYRSDGSTYGLLLYLELGPCQTGPGADDNRPWQNTIITCPF